MIKTQKGFTLIELLAGLVIIASLFAITIGVFDEITYGEKTGYVVDKEYTPARMYDGMYWGEVYKIKIEKEQKTRWVTITQEEYNNISIGECYNCE